METEPNKANDGVHSVTKVSDRDMNVPSDGGWGWLVCITSFLANGILFGIINTFGIVYIALMAEFNTEKDPLITFKTSWVGTLQIGLTFFLSPIVAILSDTVGLRQTAVVGAVIATVGMIASSFVRQLELLFITYGVLLGIGSSLVYTPCLSILPHYFSRLLGVVNGIVACGSPVLTSILSFLLTSTFVETRGLRFTLRILAVAYAVVIVCALTWKTVLSIDIKTSKSTNNKCFVRCKRYINFNIWKVKGYRMWVLALVIAYMGYFVPLVHLPNYSRTKFPDLNVGVMMTCLTVTSGISRFICGLLTDISGISAVRLQQFAFLLAGVVITCLALVTHKFALLALVAVLGIADGCMICLVGPIAVLLLGPTAASQGIGFMLGSIALPMMSGPVIAGLLYDLTFSYKLSFLLAATPTLIGACLLFAVPQQRVPTSLVNEADGILQHYEVTVEEVTELRSEKEL